MSHDGFYAVEFATPMGQGNGVVTLLGGHIRGGDSLLYYIGNYQLVGDNFTADVTTNAHCAQVGMGSVFGRNNVHITLAGKFTGEDATLSGKAAEAPDLKFIAKLKRIGP